MKAATARWRWLGHPWFLACCVLLVINDHVLKNISQSWFTGKLSDVAGIVVVAVPISVLVGLRRGLVVTGAAFACLKVVPGVAELSVLVLGGVTRRDTTDLIALLSLPVTYLVLSRPTAADRPDRLRRRLALAAGAAVPWLGLTMAVVGTSATSCGPSAYLMYVAVDGSTIYAENQASAWARSDDSGVSWQAIKKDDVPQSKRPPTPFPVDPASVSASPGARRPLPETCTASLCIRYEPANYQVERKVGSTWVVEHAGRDSYWPEPTCGGGGWAPQDPVLGPSGGPVTAAINADNYGVLVRDREGTWKLRYAEVLGVPETGEPTSPITPSLLIGWGAVLILFLVIIGLGALVAIGIIVAIHRLSRRSLR